MTSSVVKLTGDLDFSRKIEIQELLAGADYVDIAVVDLCDATYLDSSVLNGLAALKRRMTEHGTAGAIRIACANGSIRRIFEICGLDRSFEFYNSVPEAQNGSKTLA